MTRNPRGRDEPFGARGQRGFSLLETLVALAIMGIAFFGIAAGLLTTMRTSGATDARAVANAALTSLTESMKSGPYRASCDARPALQADWAGTRLLPNGRAYQVWIDRVTYWQPAQRVFATRTCPFPSGTKDGGAQLVDVSVTVSGTRLAGQVVLRDPGARP